MHTRSELRSHAGEDDVTVPVLRRRLDAADKSVIVAHAGERPVAGGPLGVSGGGEGLGHHLEQLRRQERQDCMARGMMSLGRD